MESALAWVGQIAAWLGQWIPRWAILDTTEGAIKYVRGFKVKVCGPGIHWYWPVTTTWVVYPTARQGDRLESQVMETEDGKTIIASGVIVYSVVDLAALVTTTHSPTSTVKDIAMTALHDVCCQMTWEQLQIGQRKGTLDTKLRGEAQHQLKDYGVKVVKLSLRDMAKTRVLKLSQSVSQEEN